MEENLKQLRCGECGGKKHSLYIRENNEIIAKCVMCKSTSEIVTTKPEILINHLDGNGTLCVF